MDEKLLIRMVLRVIADELVTLEWLFIQLEPQASAMEVSRAFQSARGLGWVEAEPGWTEAEPGRRRGRDPRYQLTQAGMSELEHGRSVASMSLGAQTASPAGGEMCR